MEIEERLRQLGFELPDPPQPVGNYQAWVRQGSLLLLSGQFPIARGQLKFTGRVGGELTPAQGWEAARLSALNVLAQIRAALGSFEPLRTLLRVEGHVSSAPGWHDAPKVLDGASDLFGAVLGERGRHARAAFSPEWLPRQAAVELVVTAACRRSLRAGPVSETFAFGDLSPTNWGAMA